MDVQGGKAQGKISVSIPCASGSTRSATAMHLPTDVHLLKRGRDGKGEDKALSLLFYALAMGGSVTGQLHICVYIVS